MWHSEDRKTPPLIISGNTRFTTLFQFAAYKEDMGLVQDLLGQNVKPDINGKYKYVSSSSLLTVNQC